MSEHKFKEHTKEKLDIIKDYYNTWFNIVGRTQPAFIIDTHAGTGYNEIGEEKLEGSPLLAVDMFKYSFSDRLKLFLIEFDEKRCELLKTNIRNYITDNQINAKLDDNIIIVNKDWTLAINEILPSTQNGIKLILLDPTAISSVPWDKVEPVIKLGKSEFDYKESGIEILLNWAWHAIRRQLGKYFKKEPYERKSLNAFFGPINWKEIANRYDPNLFKNENNTEIEKLREELVCAYTISFFKYFKYAKIHPVHSRKQRKEKYLKEKGKVWYYLLFSTNYHPALDIIDNKFKKYRDTKIFDNVPKNQKRLLDFGLVKSPKEKQPSKIKKINFSDKIKTLEDDLGINLYPKNKKIIKFLHGRENYDYGCFDFALYDDFQIDENVLIPFLLNNNIISWRYKKARTSGYIGKYYYLCHPRLVDNREYLFLDEKIYEVKNEELFEFKV